MITITEAPRTPERLREVKFPLGHAQASVEAFADGRVLIYVSGSGASFFWHVAATDVPNLVEALQAAIGAPAAPKKSRKGGAK